MGKNSLYNLGYRRNKPDNAIIEQETDDGIKTFQKEKGLKIDGYLLPKGETEQTIKKSVQENMQPYKGLPWDIVPEINNSLDRKEAILKNRPAKFKVENNSEASPKIPLHEIDWFNTVGRYEETINQMARKHKIDPDLVKSTMYMETSRGWYEAPKKIVDVNATLLPMNVHAKYWEDLGYSRNDLKDPEKNIEAGVKIIKGIKDRLENPSVEKISTLYQNLSAEKVSDYGARVKEIYEKKPWKKL